MDMSVVIFREGGADYDGRGILEIKHFREPDDLARRKYAAFLDSDVITGDMLPRRHIAHPGIPTSMGIHTNTQLGDKNAVAWVRGGWDENNIPVTLNEQGLLSTRYDDKGKETHRQVAVERGTNEPTTSIKSAEIMNVEYSGTKGPLVNADEVSRLMQAVGKHGKRYDGFERSPADRLDQAAQEIFGTGEYGFIGDGYAHHIIDDGKHHQTPDKTYARVMLVETKRLLREFPFLTEIRLADATPTKPAAALQAKVATYEM